jgi:hypothetical protein
MLIAAWFEHDQMCCLGLMKKMKIMMLGADDGPRQNSDNRDAPFQLHGRR